MQYARTKPKWAAPFAAAALFLAAVGCGGSDEAPAARPPEPVVLSSEAGVAGISLSRGDLVPAFSETRDNYGVTLVGTDLASISVTVTLKDAKASLFVNGVQTASGRPSAPIPLAEGLNPVNIWTESEDGKHSMPISVTVSKPPANTEVWVLDAGGGSPVPDTRVTLVESGGRVLQSDLAPRFGEPLRLYLDPSKTYDIYARGKDSAEACHANFNPSRESQAYLICRPAVKVFPVEAPRITEISYSATGQAWTPVTASCVTLWADDVKYIRVSALGRSGISPVSFGGFGIGINADTLAWTYDMREPIDTPLNSKGEMVQGVQYYRTTCVFESPFTSMQPSSSHFLNVVVYDVAFNRTEQRVYVEVADASLSAPADTDLTNVKPTMNAAQAQTFGVSNEIFYSVQPVDGESITYWVICQFRPAAASPYPGIRGYELQRSNDGVYWTRIQGTNYQNPVSDNTGTAGVFQAYDIDPTLTAGRTYHYRVRVYNGNPANGGYSQWSDPLYVKPLPPFVATLDEPASYSVTKTRKPAFTFNISNPALWDKDVCDRFFFTLYIKLKTGAATHHIPMYYDFDEGAYYYDANFGATLTDLVDLLLGRETWIWTAVPADWDIRMSEDRRTMTIPWPTIAGDSYNDFAGGLTPTCTYEWSIYGQGASTSPGSLARSPHFRQTYGANRAYSCGSNAYYGNSAVNGLFTLTVAPDAE